MIGNSSALSKLVEKKRELVKAREYAELREKKMKTAGDLLGTNVKNDFDLGRAEKTMDDEQRQEYINRTFSTDEKVEEKKEDNLYQAK
jgi:hypothetical protein